MSLNISIHKSIQDFTADQWQALCPVDFPFWDYEFLKSLEQSGTLGERTGWYPCYLVAKQDKELLGSLPLYIKTNSYGEYIFDWQWANAYAQSGIPYYPKLVSAVPFTPANGPKILFSPMADRELVASMLLQAAIKLLNTQGYSSMHGLFVSAGEAALWQAEGFKIRSSYQYHWFNNGYQGFDDFLSQLKGKRRRQVQKERQQVVDTGLKIRVLTGDQLNSSHGPLFYQFYLQTLDKKSGMPYLTADFFSLAISRMPDRTILILAEDSFGKAVAASLSFWKGSVIYGRYWGCTANYPCLHFELCYYQLIDLAINKGCQRVEAGAQGEHKIQRGFQPTRMLSSHWIAHASFRQGIERFIDEEEIVVLAGLKEDREHLPFRN